MAFLKPDLFPPSCKKKRPFDKLSPVSQNSPVLRNELGTSHSVANGQTQLIIMLFDTPGDGKIPESKYV